MMQRSGYLLQRWLGGALCSTPLLLASAGTSRRGAGRAGAASSAAALEAAEAAAVETPDLAEVQPDPGASSRSRQRRGPAQLLADLGGSGDAHAVERLLQKHQHAAVASPVPSRARAKPRGGHLVVPPVEVVEAPPTTGGGGGGGDGDVDTYTMLLPSSSAAPAATPAQQQQQQQQLLTNPFRGLHSNVSRSYRVDQLTQESTAADVMIARQERKSTAFSFLHFRAGEAFYQGHWGSVADMQAQLDASAAAAQRTSSARAAKPYVRGTPIPGLTLFNNDLGLHNPLVQCSYPLIVAQRLLLFPDHQRHFHTICGREDVPCDFYADIDLPGESPAGAEAALLEVLNYLEVRLPGIGFTDPFFLVLTNAVPSKGKVSYHVHARSVTHVLNRAAAAAAARATVLPATPRPTAKAKAAGRLKKSNAAAAAAKFAEEAGELPGDGPDEEPYDDLSDMVSAVEGGGKAGTSSSSSSSSSRAATAKVIAFQDYRTVKLIADEVNQTLGRDVVDLNCYRPNGMLRCAFSSKMSSTQEHNHRLQVLNSAEAAQKRLVPLLTASDPALQRRLTEMEAVLRRMSDPEILELTFCTRHLDMDGKVVKAAHQHAASLLVLDSHAAAESEEQQRRAAVLAATTRHRFKLVRARHVAGPQGSQAVEYDAYGNVVSPFLTEGAKWRRFKSVTARLRTLPPRAAESYDVWVRVGLALHNFSNEDHVFEEWVLFSLKSPLKYSREVCRKKWLQFERNPDALNWRRGFNYLNTTVWRQV